MTRSAAQLANLGATSTTVDALVQLSFLVHGSLERRATAEDLSISQMRLLGILRDRTPTMNELAGFLDLDKSSITGLVERAQRRGLVTRRPSRTDRRVVEVRISARGRKLVARVAALVQSDVDVLLESLPASDRAAVTRVTGRILESHAAARGIDLFDTH